MTTYAIETAGLAKAFGKTRAVDGVDLRIRKGSVFGLLGPNGAGKTTTIRLLATLLRPDAGSATVLGYDVVREASTVRQKVSLTGQYASVDDDLTGHENLVLVGRLLGLPWRDAKERATDLLGAFGLDEAAKRQVRTYSGGMRRRIDIAASLVVTPEVLFLDEPTSGLDPRSRNQVWDIVRRIAGQGTTVLLTTQYLEEADRLAERLAVIDHGRVIAEGTSRDLKASVGASALHVRVPQATDRAAAVAAAGPVQRDGLLPQTDATALTMKVDGVAQASAVLAALAKAGVPVLEFSLGNPSLDDVFFALTGRPAEAAADGEAGAAKAAGGGKAGHGPNGRAGKAAAKAAKPSLAGANGAGATRNGHAAPGAPGRSARTTPRAPALTSAPTPAHTPAHPPVKPVRPIRTAGKVSPKPAAAKARDTSATEAAPASKRAPKGGAP